MMKMNEKWARRLSQYKRFGHNRAAAVDAILLHATPLASPTLDIGTGKGMIAQALARAAVRVVTIDIDPAQLQAAKQLMGKDAASVQFVLGDASHMPLDDRAFGLVVSVNAVHHLVDFEPIAVEIFRVLKPGGRVVVADFTDEGFRILDRAFAEDGTVHHTTGLRLDDAIEALDRIGMRVVDRAQAHQQDIVVLQRVA